MFEMLLILAVVAVLVLGAAYVAGAIRTRDENGKAGLIRYTVGVTLSAIVLLALVLSTRLGFLMLYVTPAIVVLLTPLCVLTSALVEMRARRAGTGIRRALVVGAVLCFGGWGILMISVLARGLGTMNPDGRQHSFLARPAVSRAS